MIGLGFEWVGLDRVYAGFTKIEQSIEVLHPLWDKIDDEFYAQETQHFAAAPWAPLSQAYAKRKAETSGKPLLRVMDVLFKSLTEPGAPEGVRRPTNLSLEIGSRDFKAMLHQEGTDRMPARPPLAEPDEDRYATIAGAYLEEIVKNAGFN